MNTAQTIGQPLTAPALPANGAMHWVADIVNECITGEKTKQGAGRDAEWTLVHKEDALRFFAQVTGKDVQHFCTDGYGRHALLVNENAVVLVNCPAEGESHSELLHIKSDGREWLKSKIKGERQAWLKANRHEHYMQCQFAMMCTRTKKCYYISYDRRPAKPCDRMAVIELLHDEKVQKDIADRINYVATVLKTLLADSR